MKSFFPMRRSELFTLGFLVAFAAFAFHPAWRTVELGGMAVFGWLVAALMLLSPALALAAFLARTEPSPRRPDEGAATEGGEGDA